MYVLLFIQYKLPFTIAIIRTLEFYFGIEGL